MSFLEDLAMERLLDTEVAKSLSEESISEADETLSVDAETEDDLQKEYTGYDTLVTSLMEKHGWDQERAERQATHIGRRKFGPAFDAVADSGRKTS